MGIKVLVTGAASHLAKVLLPRLLHHSDIERVIGLDIKTTGVRHEKYQEVIRDIRDQRLSDVMSGCDLVIHLAFVVLPQTLGSQRKDRKLIREINVQGSQNLICQASSFGVKQFIHLSSSVIYGAWPANPAQMDESQPLKVMPGFSYSEDKVAVERFIEQFRPQAKQMKLVSLRPHVILGPHAQPLLRFMLKQPFYPRLPDPQPLSQCVWEDDVVDAIMLSLAKPDVEGAFNLAADPPLSFKAMQSLMHNYTFALPFWLVKLVHKLQWHLHGAGGEPGWVDGMSHSLAVSSEKAKTTLGWQAHYTTHDCLSRLKDEFEQ